MRSWTTIAALLVCCAGPLSAQVDTLPAGARLRISFPTASAEARLVGRLERVTADSLTVRVADGGSRALPVNGIERVELSRGRSRALWTGAGVAAGAVAGILVTRAGNDEPEDIGGIGGVADGINNTLIGALAGGVLGFLLAPERWRQVHLSPR
jgi:hypothetical protein